MKPEKSKRLYRDTYISRRLYSTNKGKKMELRKRVKETYGNNELLITVLFLIILAGIIRIILLSVTIDNPGDGQGWARMAFLWSRDPYFKTSGVFLPGFMYLAGLVDIFLPYNPYFSPRLLNTILGTLTVPVFYILLNKLYGRKVAIFSSLLLSLLPIHAGLSVSSLTEASHVFEILIGFLFLIYAIEKKEKRWVFICLSLFFLTLANMTRYESWMFIPLWPAYLYWKTRDKTLSLAFLTFLLAFPIFWMTGNYVASGSPLIGFFSAAESGPAAVGANPVSFVKAVIIILKKLAFQLSIPVMALILLGVISNLISIKDLKKQSPQILYLSIFFLFWSFMLYFAMLRGRSLWVVYLLFGIVIALPFAFFPFRKFKFFPIISFIILCLFIFLVVPPIYQELSETSYARIYVTKVKPIEMEQVASWLKESDYKSDYILMTRMGWKSKYLLLYFPEVSDKVEIVSPWANDTELSRFIESHHPTLLITRDSDKEFIERVERLTNHNFTRDNPVYQYGEIKVFRIPHDER